MNFLASKKQLRASFLRWSLFCVPLIVLLGFLGGKMGSPDSLWFQSLNKPAILIPLVNADNNQHAPNENLRIGNFYSGTESLYHLFTTPYAQ